MRFENTKKEPTPWEAESLVVGTLIQSAASKSVYMVIVNQSYNQLFLCISRGNTGSVRIGKIFDEILTGVEINCKLVEVEE